MLEREEFKPRESPLLDYTKAIKQVIIKIAVNKLLDLATNKNEES